MTFWQFSYILDAKGKLFTSWINYSIRVIYFLRLLTIGEGFELETIVEKALVQIDEIKGWPRVYIMKNDPSNSILFFNPFVY